MDRAAIAAKPAKPAGADQRTTLLRRREEHRRERGAALLDGKEFDGAALARTEAELAALDDAEAEASRRAAQAAAKVRGEQGAAVRGRVAEADAARVDALAKAEQAALAMVKALADYRRGCAVIVNELHTLGPTVPGPLLPRAVDRRLGDLIGGALFEIRSDRYSLGELEWHRPTTGPVADWPAVDRAATAKAIGAALLRGTS